MTQNPHPSQDPRSRRKEALQLTAAIAVIVCAILLGFALGLRTGDWRERRHEAETAANLHPVDTLPADTVAVEPEPPQEPVETGPSKKEATLGVEYLASHNRWNRNEMEQIPALQGLWDAVNTYSLDELRRYNEVLSSTPLTTVIESLERNPKQGYYAAKGDQVITLSTYIKRLR